MRTTTLAATLGLAAALTIVPLATTPAAAAAATCDGRAATIVVPLTATGPTPVVAGTPGDDVIVGTERGDRIDGGGGDDTICGLGGDDHIMGGGGDDRLFGGLDDTYYADDDYWGDVIEPGPGDDYVDLGADLGPDDVWWGDTVYADQVSYAGAPGPVTVDLTTLTATGEGTDTFAPTPAGKFTGIVGSPYDDVLLGGPAADQIHGGGGDDLIAGRDGDDLLDGDLNRPFDKRYVETYVPGDDRVEGGPGDDLVEGGRGADRLSGDEGEDTLSAVKARGTTLSGGTEDDYLSADEGTTARGNGGNDTFRISLGNGRRVGKERAIIGGAGRDHLQLESYVAGRITYRLSVSVPKRRIMQSGRRLARIADVEEFVLDGNKGRGLVTFTGGPEPELFRVRWATGFPVRAFGGGGADVLIGGNRGDLLDGGRGRDRLVGSDGKDRCLRGETLRSCESRR